MVPEKRIPGGGLEMEIGGKGGGRVGTKLRNGDTKGISKRSITTYGMRWRRRYSTGVQVEGGISIDLGMDASNPLLRVWVGLARGGRRRRWGRRHARTDLLGKYPPV